MRRVKYRAVVEPGRLRRFRRTMKRWYQDHGRDLPWRRTRDPYAVLVSEILLHQTTVATVAPVYEAFLTQFPTVEALAAADLADVKRLTDPLGYKVRGQWLFNLAGVIMAEHGGVVPDSLDALMRLPGVGRYTAGAVLSFAYDRPAGVLDTNVTRVLARFFRVAPDGRADRQHQLWALAEAVVPRRGAWSFNQGLMDFGALCCRAKHPQCTACPLARHCPTRGEEGRRAAEGAPEGVWFWESPDFRRRAR